VLTLQGALLHPLAPQAGSEGGAVHVETEWAAGSGNQMVLQRVIFDNNTADVMGGALVVNGQGCVLLDALLYDNAVR
jgi:hypothetical protein